MWHPCYIFSFYQVTYCLEFCAWDIATGFLGKKGKKKFVVVSPTVLPGSLSVWVEVLPQGLLGFLQTWFKLNHMRGISKFLQCAFSVTLLWVPVLAVVLPISTTLELPPNIDSKIPPAWKSLDTHLNWTISLLHDDLLGYTIKYPKPYMIGCCCYCKCGCWNADNSEEDMSRVVSTVFMPILHYKDPKLLCLQTEVSVFGVLLPWMMPFFLFFFFEEIMISEVF